VTVKIEPLFGGTDFITDAQRETVEKAARYLRPIRDMVHSEDEREDGVLSAIYNTETSWGHSVAFKLEVTPTGVVRSFEWDSINDPEEWDWEDATGLGIWEQITSTGVSYEVDDV
jgi:hypothetical protein